MRVAFVVGGQFAVELNLQVDPDPNNIATSLTNEVNTAIQQRPELAQVGGVYAVTWAADNFGSHDDLEAGDVELSEISSIVIWATQLPRKRVARSVKQVVEVPIFEELVRKRKSSGGDGKRRRLTDAGYEITI